MIVKNRFIDIKQLLLKINLNSITKMARLDMKPLTGYVSDMFSGYVSELFCCFCKLLNIFM